MSGHLAFGCFSSPAGSVDMAVLAIYVRALVLPHARLVTFFFHFFLVRRWKMEHGGIFGIWVFWNYGISSFAGFSWTLQFLFVFSLSFLFFALVLLRPYQYALRNPHEKSDTLR